MLDEAWSHRHTARAGWIGKASAGTSVRWRFSIRVRISFRLSLQLRFGSVPGACSNVQDPAAVGIAAIQAIHDEMPPPGLLESQVCLLAGRYTGEQGVK